VIDRPGRLSGKIALVTGGSQGIGRACAELFAEEDATVIVGDVREPEPYEAPNITFEKLDVTREADWKRVVGSVIERHSHLDIVLNNAGAVGSFDSLDTISLEDWDRVIALNMTGAFYAVRTTVPTMRANNGGSIILVSSTWGITSAPGACAYTASKGAVRLMAKNAALSYVGDGIRVNSLHPGISATPMVAGQDAATTEEIVAATPMKRIADPREIAFGALFLASNESSFMTGAELVIDGGFTAQ
jgi:NAD(P)-dependent dehydrogenase (short-subunit alcohol dehydrogenase family)